MDRTSGFGELNAGYIADLYERFLRDPSSVDPSTRSYFESFQDISHSGSRQGFPAKIDFSKIILAVNYANSIRTYGHLAAKIDPLGNPPHGDPTLDQACYGLADQDLQDLPASIVSGPAAASARNAFEAVARIKEIYCTTRGYEYGHLKESEERDWLREAAESGRFRPPAVSIDERHLLDRLSQVEAFEQFIHRHFPGRTRFSIEGVDMLIPALDEIVGGAADAGICTLLIGMAHRGRLNVLAHILKKPYTDILTEFRDPKWNFSGLDQLGWTGDVKYHKGATRELREGQEVRLVITLAPNPSHLEHVNPVIEGMARSAGSKTDQRGAPTFFPLAALPVLIHGDAAFPGEGITAETLNFSKLDGYETGGTIHIITNNQLGYTTTASEGRSTLYASDLAKGFEIPIIHVNADDPVTVIEAARTAFEFRDLFKKDILIDLVGYRRYGHNEGDEPSFTQPVLYEQIGRHPSVRQILADQMVRAGQIPSDEPQRIYQRRMDELQSILNNLKTDKISPPPPLRIGSGGGSQAAETGCSLAELQALNTQLVTFPDGFRVNRKLERPIQRRRAAAEDPVEKSIDWAAAEGLAFASILSDGIPIRLTGQDVERGTFSQRHAVFHDAENGRRYVPLQSIPQAQAAFDIHNSPLSENAALGFEFGYSVFYPRRMTIWEAQYGDFVNTAQAVVDEFITSAQAKWEQKPSLVLLLPHGYEGQGPDHSSGRPERFLQLATPGSLKIANCTTAAQYFHVLRLHAASLGDSPVPLILFTPKSLLRNPFVASSLQELASGRWEPVIDDAGRADKRAVRRMLLCTGKISVDLLTDPGRDQHPEVAIVRVEQLFPFPGPALEAILGSYPNLESLAWVQEEPENMGVWDFARPKITQICGEKLELGYIGRPFSSSPAEGSTTWHVMNQAELIGQAFEAEVRSGSQPV